MSLSYKQFESYVKDLYETSTTLGDTWKICHSANGDEDNIYLTKSAFIVSQDSVRTLWEYHIIYSYSYHVPILYFNVCFCNGKLLTFSELEKFVHPVFKQQFSENQLRILTQQEHPFCRRPFFTLHPCKTEEFMQYFIGCSIKINPLITWLSTIAPMVNLKISPDYGTTTFNG